MGFFVNCGAELLLYFGCKIPKVQVLCGMSIKENPKSGHSVRVVPVKF